MAVAFDYSAAMRRLCEDFAARLPEFAHIAMTRAGVGVVQARNASPLGMYAAVVPLRFKDGASTALRRGRKMTLQRIVGLDGGELLYLVNFYLPRFQNLPLDEKLTTIAHELWHISPQFNGDVRRFAGRCYAHSGSKDRFDAHAAALARKWLAAAPPPSLYEFLRLDFGALKARYGRIQGMRFPLPKVIPVGEASAPPRRRGA